MGCKLFLRISWCLEDVFTWRRYLLFIFINKIENYLILHSSVHILLYCLWGYYILFLKTDSLLSAKTEQTLKRIRKTQLREKASGSSHNSSFSTSSSSFESDQSSDLEAMRKLREKGMKIYFFLFAHTLQWSLIL